MTDESFARLLVVQDLDTSITQLAHRREMLAERSGLTGLEAELAALAGERGETVGTAGCAHCDPEGSRGADRHDQRAQQRDRDADVRRHGSSTRDLQAMNEEVRHLTERRSELEDEELVAMLEQDPIDAELAALARPHDAGRGEGGRSPGRGRAGPARRSMPSWRRRTASRATEAAQLPTALADRYETLRTRLKGTGAARLIGNRCDGCHLELSSGEVERIRDTPPDRWPRASSAGASSSRPEEQRKPTC